MSESKSKHATSNEMVINYVPGEECRVAVVHDGKLEEFHAERSDAVSHVGNIYVGKVRNVEPAIQAAFVDFGLEQNGFLHVSDLHPQYFPGEGDDTTELVGKKTPRRERPPIQECLRRGQEIAVQVLKEGVGTKGPTVTSYLSIPGRFLVMMPNMDRVGVSRKVEDEETRRAMRDILDQLELPDGFGFIVRTAGMERTKAELKRDLAYLQRLWKDIEKRWGKGGNKPRLLYSESDLLMRALRDMVTPDLERIVIDDESATMRAARFLKIVSPRTSTRLVRYTGKAPVFHAMGIEEQIRTMYSREVPLPSGGRLVIDETEALVAIDVNSGKMRDARDAETNAYRTNQEAAEEICRQLKLRDVGGIVVNDLIDMRSLKHRREIEGKFKELLKRDRARTTLEQISQFGILEMTRQRMRGSYESVHFTDCPTCRGRGLVQRPDSVAADAMRELAALLQHERVVRIEMAVGPRIAGELLSSKRRALNRLERSSGKHVEVRVSENVPVDRVTFYCYDDRGADIDVGRLSPRRASTDELQVFELPSKSEGEMFSDAEEETKAAMAIEPPEPEPAVVETPDPFLDALEMDVSNVTEDGAEGGEQGGGRRGGRRRRGRGRGRGRGGERGSEQGGRAESQGRGAPQEERAAPDADRPAPEARAQEQGERADGDERGEGGRRRRRRRRRGRGRGGDQGAEGHAPVGDGARAGTPIFDEEQGGTDDEAPAPEAHGHEPSSWDLEVSEAHSVQELEPEGAPPEDSENEHIPEAAEGPEAAGGEGDAAPEGEQAEQGERRGRRRRRRRGRGRGRGGEGGEAGQGGSHAEGAGETPQDEDSSEAAAPVAGDREPGEDETEADAAAHADDAGDDGRREGDAEDTAADAEGSQDGGGEGGEGGERRGRRRRRRRGRGRGRGEGGGNAANDGGNPQTGQGGAPASDGRGSRGEGRRDDRGGRGERGDRGSRGERGGRGGNRDQRSAGQPRVEPKARQDSGGGGGGRSQGQGGGQNAQQPPKGGSASQPSAGGNKLPQPRVLYSSRRKLLPSERARMKPGDA
jgi:ribonuclease E